MRKLIIQAALTVAFTACVMADNTIAFVEKFVLAEDRAQVLEELVPGSEDYFFYSALHYQNSAQANELTRIMDQWRKQRPRSDRRKIIENREALIHFNKDPDKAVDYLRLELGLEFKHERDRRSTDPALPFELDPNDISWEAFAKRYLDDRKDLGKINNTGLANAIRENKELSMAKLRELLSRVDLPDFPKITDLVLRELNDRESRGFGHFAIHNALTRLQMDALANTKPELLQSPLFVHNYIRRLLPDNDKDWVWTPEVRKVYLNELWQFVEPLAPAFNSLKAHTLYQILNLERAAGNYPADLFAAYLELPRAVHYINPRFLDQRQKVEPLVQLGEDFSRITGCPVIGRDEELVRDYLLHLLVDAENYEAYAKWLSEDWLKAVFAESKILNARGERDQWVSLLDPAAYKALVERVDIDFASQNPRFFTVDDTIDLAVDVKNVDKLIVKLYELNTLNYYRLNNRQINTDIDLDGLVPNEERTVDSSAPPVHRIRHQIAFPSLKGRRGVWVVEMIGNGKSSRALIRKGDLRVISRTIPQGEALSVLTENDKVVQTPTVWLGNREFRGEKGVVIVPFTSNADSGNIVLVDEDGFASLQNFEHPAENYAFDAGFSLNREQLLAGMPATLLVRPTLRMGAHPISLSRLKDVRITVTSTNLDGINASRTYPSLEISDDADIAIALRVPERLQHLAATIEAKVELVSQNGKNHDLSKSTVFSINAIDATAQTSDFHLTKIDDLYFIEWLGKNGEPQKKRPALVEIRHHDFNDDINFTMQCGDDGRIALGALTDISRVKVSADGIEPKRWELRRDRVKLPDRIHAATGENIEVPFFPLNEGTPVRGEYSLLEVRDGNFVQNATDKVSYTNGFLKMEGLSQGDYTLTLPYTNQSVSVRVAAGATSPGLVLGRDRHLTTGIEKKLQISALEKTGNKILIQLANHNATTRVHVMASRTRPAFDPFSQLAIAPPEPVQIRLAKRPSAYVSGRKMGDEQRYIIDRRYEKLFPGNMLSRPGLLLNPWELRETDTGRDRAADGEQYKSAALGTDAAQEPGEGQSLQRKANENVDPSNLDFFGLNGVLLTNLRPNASGMVEISGAELGDRPQVYVIALDSFNTVTRSLSLPDPGTRIRDRRLAHSLPTDGHFTRTREVNIVNKGESIKSTGIGDGELEFVDSLESLHRFFVARGGHEHLQEFRFLLEWPNLEPVRKSELYSKYACHELSFFLAHKDPEFFKTVIHPYIANKHDKTFIDDYLLGIDLKKYLRPWAFGRLNAAERALLARRLGGDQQKEIVRHLQDAVDLIPPELTNITTDFDSGIAIDGLSTEAFGISRLARPSAAPAAPAAATASVAGGLVADKKMLRKRSNVESKNGLAARGFGRGVDEELGEAVVEFNAVRDAEKEVDFSPAEASRVLEESESVALGLFDLGDADLAELSLEERKVRNLYRKVGSTREWAENNYYRVPIEQQIAELITPNAFWHDLALWDEQQPFLSKHFIHAHNSFAECMLALGVLDLPFQASEHPETQEDDSRTFTAGNGLLVFRSEMREAPLAEEQAGQLLVSQNFYRHGDRYRRDGNQQFDKFVTDEFLVGAVYGCELVVTNSSSTPVRAEIVYQIPSGAVPVSGSRFVQTIPQLLAGYSTVKHEYFFYFPKDGEFPHYPVHIGRDSKTLASADPKPLKAVNELSNADTQSWEYVSQWSDNKAVLDFIAQNNVGALNLDRIAWRLKDNAFYTAFMQALRKRHLFHPTVFSYALLHGDIESLEEFLQHQDGFVNHCGAYLKSPVLDIDPVARHQYQQMEYDPLVNARAHQLGSNRRVLNPAFHQQYHGMLNVLQFKGKLADYDRMILVYYLFLQDRVEEALAQLDRTNPANLETRLQYDYLKAYAAIYREDPNGARAIARRYADYPVDKWRQRFELVTNQLAEIDGGDVADPEKEDRDAAHDALASTDPRLALRVENNRALLTHAHVKEITVNYYEMDLEFLFSANPFLSSDSSRFRIVKPNITERRVLNNEPALGGELKLTLPDSLAGKNVLVEVNGGGMTASAPVYSNTLDLRFAENYGRVEVRRLTDKRPLSKAYIKVYARYSNGEIAFYKDGYTDLRGKFDYTSLNTNEIERIQRFSVMVISPANGASVQEMGPPQM